MKYNKKDRWTINQEAFIRANWQDMKDERFAVILGRTLKSVRLKRRRMGLEKAPGHGISRSKRDWDIMKGKLNAPHRYDED